MGVEHIVTDFWRSADLHPPGQEQPLARLRNLILATQQPATCKRVCTLTNAYHGGALSDVRRLAYALMYAIVNDCALTTQWPLYTKTNRSSSLTTSTELRRRCATPSRLGLRCYFLPPSQCRETDGAEQQNGTRRTFSLANFHLAPTLAAVQAKTGLHSEMLLMGTLVAWIMRPQSELSEAIVHYGTLLGLSRPGARQRRLSLHIRHGDKHSLYAKHLRNDSWRVQPQNFDAWARRIAADLGLDSALFMTDDIGAMDALLPSSRPPPRDRWGSNDGFFALAPAPRICLPSFSVGSFGKSYLPAVRSLMKLHKPKETAEIERRTANLTQTCGPKYMVDDGIQLFAGVALLAQTSAFVGTQISNVDSAVAELMATLRFPPTVFDVLNDVHRACLSDESVWHGAVHPHRRDLIKEHLAGKDGAVANVGDPC